MACFTAPLAEAVIVSVVKAVAFNKNKIAKENTDGGISEVGIKASIRTKLGWLEKMLYGGSFLLAIEHIYHGEVVLYPPFLTAMNNPEDVPVMLHEIATVGVGMAALVTAVWGAAVAVSHFMKKRTSKTISEVAE